MPETANEFASQNTTPETRRMGRDKEKTRLYMAPYMAQYREDQKIAAPLGLTVGQYREQQRKASAVAQETNKAA